MASTGKGAGASNIQDRGRQPKRAGGNSFEYGIESHDQRKALRIGIRGIGGVDAGDTGTNKTWGAQRDEGGNEATAASAIEKHGHGAEYVDHLNGRNIAKHSLIPSNIELAQRDKAAGNCSGGEHLPTGRGSQKVTASRRFNS